MNKLFPVSTLAVLLVSGAAAAQSSSGAIVVTAEAGDKVVIYSDATGFKRERDIEKSGQTGFRRMPLGTYIVTITKPDGTSTDVTVTLHGGTTAKVPR